MHSILWKYRWSVSAFVLATSFTTSAFAADGSAVLDLSYWLWLCGRIGVPGG